MSSGITDGADNVHLVAVFFFPIALFLVRVANVADMESQDASEQSGHLKEAFHLCVRSVHLVDSDRRLFGRPYDWLVSTFPRRPR